MKYGFNNIDDPIMYNSCSVMFITGQYNIFNNIVIDELRSRSVSSDGFKEDESLLAEFGISTKNTSEIKVSSSVDFQTFIDVVGMPNVTGKWFCSIDLGTISKKHKDILNKYIKKPSNNGILVVYSNDFKDYREYLRNKALTQGEKSHIISLSFPNREILLKIVKQLFEKRNILVKDKAAELFVMRLSNAYDDYDELIEKLSIGKEGKEVTYEEMIDGLKGVENFVLDDLLQKLLIPVPNNSTSANKRMYRMVSALEKEFGADKLVSKLKYKIEDYIEFRLAINSGIIPIKVRYSLTDVRSRIDENSRLAKISDFQFRRMAFTASQTSLRDWMYMKLILNNVTNRFKGESYEKVLYSLINRSNLNEHRLNTDIGLVDKLSPELDYLNNIVYIDPKDIDKLVKSEASSADS